MFHLKYTDFIHYAYNFLVALKMQGLIGVEQLTPLLYPGFSGRKTWNARQERCEHEATVTITQGHLASSSHCMFGGRDAGRRRETTGRSQ